jgi:plastocyanin
MLKKNLIIASILIAGLACFAGSCKKKDTGNDNTSGADSGKPAYSSKGDEGSITGKISFNGTAPTPKKIDEGQDAYCASAPGEKTTEDVVVSNGKLANVFVYVKSGGAVDKYSFPAPATDVVLDQKGCRYHPHVMGLETGQNLKVVNSDQTTHNVHPSPSKNPEWNQSQAPGAPPIEKKFNKPETLIPVKCNQHPWMKAYVGVLAHPFYAVSSEADGSYTIKGLPPGEYTIVAWHEKFPEQTQKVTVAAKETKALDFTFSGSTARGPSSLREEPALILP